MNQVKQEVLDQIREQVRDIELDIDKITNDPEEEIEADNLFSEIINDLTYELDLWSDE
jgi:hypothetical protein